MKNYNLKLTSDELHWLRSILIKEKSEWEKIENKREDDKKVLEAINNILHHVNDIGGLI